MFHEAHWQLRGQVMVAKLSCSDRLKVEKSLQWVLYIMGCLSLWLITLLEYFFFSVAYSLLDKYPMSQKGQISDHDTVVVAFRSRFSVMESILS